jgi:WD40 repeat protein
MRFVVILTTLSLVLGCNVNEPEKGKEKSQEPQQHDKAKLPAPEVVGTEPVPKEGSLGISVATFSPDGKYIVTGGQITLWDAGIEQPDVKAVFPNVDPPKGLWTVKLKPRDGNRYPTVDAVSFSRDGKEVYALLRFNDMTVKAWGRENRKELRGFRIEPGDSAHAVFLPDGKHLVSLHEREFRFWELSTGKCVRVIPTGLIKTGHLLLSNDGKRLVTWASHYDPSKDRNYEEVKEWDLGTGKLTQSVGEDRTFRTVRPLAYLPDGRVVLGLSDSRKTWDTRTGQLVPFADGFKDARRIVYSPDGKRAATIDNKGRVQLRDPATGRVTHTLPDYGFSGTILFSPDSRQLLLAGMLRPPDDPKRSPPLPPDSRVLLLWDFDETGLVRTLAYPTPRPVPK